MQNFNILHNNICMHISLKNDICDILLGTRFERRKVLRRKFSSLKLKILKLFYLYIKTLWRKKLFGLFLRILMTLVVVGEDILISLIYNLLKVFHLNTFELRHSNGNKFFNSQLVKKINIFFKYLGTISKICGINLDKI